MEQDRVDEIDDDNWDNDRIILVKCTFHTTNISGRHISIIRVV